MWFNPGTSGSKVLSVTLLEDEEQPGELVLSLAGLSASPLVVLPPEMGSNPLVAAPSSNCAFKQHPEPLPF